jgi:hypothetical protein
MAVSYGSANAMHRFIHKLCTQSVENLVDKSVDNPVDNQWTALWMIRRACGNQSVVPSHPQIRRFVSTWNPQPQTPIYLRKRPFSTLPTGATTTMILISNREKRST